jgi:hypothetical protein
MFICQILKNKDLAGSTKNEGSGYLFKKKANEHIFLNELKNIILSQN